MVHFGSGGTMCEFCNNLQIGREASANDTDGGLRLLNLKIADDASMCGSAYIAIKQRFVAEGVDISKVGGYLLDYMKIYCIMSSERIFLRELTSLNDTIRSHPVASPAVDWLRLSSILSSFERKCLFQEAVLIPLGFLPPEEFLYLIRRGYVLKDYGADVLHGEFTHRLQWFVLMSVITRGFSIGKNDNWDHTPLDLYTRCAEFKIWGLLLDKNKNAEEGEPKFSHPDELNAWLNSKRSEDSIGKLCQFLESRNRKRGDELMIVIAKYIEDLEEDDEDLPALFDKADITRGTAFTGSVDGGEEGEPRSGMATGGSGVYTKPESGMEKLSDLPVRDRLNRLFTSDPNDPDSAFHPFDRFKKIEGWMRTQYIPAISNYDKDIAERNRENFLDRRDSKYKKRKMAGGRNEPKRRDRSLYAEMTIITSNILAPPGTAIDSGTEKIDAQIGASRNLREK